MLHVLWLLMLLPQVLWVRSLKVVFLRMMLTSVDKFCVLSAVAWDAVVAINTSAVVAINTSAVVASIVAIYTGVDVVAAGDVALSAVAVGVFTVL